MPGTAQLVLSGTTRLATKQTGEPNHAGDPGGHSAWYSWTPLKAPRSSSDACTAFQPLIGVYTGSAVNTLTPVPIIDSGSVSCEEERASASTPSPAPPTGSPSTARRGDDGRFDLHLRPAIEHARSFTSTASARGLGRLAFGSCL